MRPQSFPFLALAFATTACLFAQKRNLEVTSYLEVVSVETRERKVVLERNFKISAPNWSPTDNFFVVNYGGRLYKVNRTGTEVTEIDTGSVKRCNNDHGISPDGTLLAISSASIDEKGNRQRSKIYTAPIGGGEPVEITKNELSYWHGWSPDGKTLTYTGFREKNVDIYTIPVTGGEETRLTDDPGHDDGSDYSADGKYIYWNSSSTGSMEIWRMKVDGSEKIQITDDIHSNWFPHPSPNGKYLVYLCYLEDQGKAHPSWKDVKLRLIDLETNVITDLTDVFLGGQGTINVPSWSPDSQYVAFVSYDHTD